MKNFNKDRNKRNSGFNKRDSGRNFNRDSQRPTMHSAICDSCKKTCEVPFKPVGNKPIYCSSCFSKQSGSRENRFNNRDRKPRFERGGSRENRFNKPRFENRDNNKSSQSHEEILKGIKALNYKLDELFKFLPKTTPTKKPKAKVKKKVAKKKVAKKKVVKKK